MTRGADRGTTGTGPHLWVTVGLPGTGKTTRARELAARHGAVRLTPDEWMLPLFGTNDVDGRRDVLEGRLIWTAHEVLRSGGRAVLDFGVWSPEERWALRAVAGLAGAGCTLVECSLPEAERRARCRERWRTAPHTTVEMTEADQDRYLAAYTPPGPAEHRGTPLPPPPDGVLTWTAWASTRWPSLPDLAVPVP